MSLSARLAGAIDRHFAASERVPVTVNVTPEAIREHLRDQYDFSRPTPPDDLFTDVDRMLREWTEHASHPMHFGLFRPATDEASVIAEALAALYDPNLATWDFAPAANEIERHVLSLIGSRFGFVPETLAAHFTSGGQEANQTAVAVALTHAFPAAVHGGLRALPGQPVFYVSEEAHHSLDKVAHASGLGRSAIRKIPAGADLRMDVGALRTRIAEDRDRGFLPFLVVATAGTTNAGVIDPLPDLAEVASENGLWLHVDAAWGGGAILSDRLRHLLDGIERSDSITCDAHKLISVPVGAGMFFTRHPGAVRATFEVSTAYVPDRAEGRGYPFISTMQWSRRCMGLKLFMMFAARGLPEIARRIEHQAAMGDVLREGLEARGWIVANDSALAVVCFTHPTIAGNPSLAATIVRRLRESGEAWISKTDLRGSQRVLRACVTNFNTGPEHIQRLIGLVERELEACNRAR